MKYRRNENITAIQWDGTFDGILTVKKEMPEILIPWVQSKEKYLKYHILEIIYNGSYRTESDDYEDTSIILKGGEYLVRIEDYLGGVVYRTYSKECFEDAFTKE